MRTALQQARVRTITAIGIMLLLVACAAPEPTPTPVPPTPEIVAILEVTFDGNECNCVWPESAPPGEVTIIFNNESQGLASARFFKQDEGKTWDDQLALIDPPPGTAHMPSWCRLVTMVQTTAGKSTARNAIVTTGLYGLVCYVKEPFGIWPGAPLYVEE